MVMIYMHLVTNDYTLSIRENIGSLLIHKQYGKTVMKFNGKEMWNVLYRIILLRNICDNMYDFGEQNSLFQGCGVS